MKSPASFIQIALVIVVVVAAQVTRADGVSTLASIEATTSAGQHCAHPHSIDLDQITDLPAASLRLLDRDKRAVPFQITNGSPRLLTWVAPMSTVTGTSVFELQNKSDSADFPQLRQRTEDGRLVIAFAEQELLGYQFEWMAPPAGVNAVYGRSAFIHPLWSPRGQILTRIQPEDHYHHYGIWNPWTQMEYDGETYDLWNLIGRQGTVRFAGFTTENSGPVFSEFTAHHEHVANIDGVTPVVILDELQTIRVFRPQSGFCYLMEMTIDLSAATKKSVNLLEHRYGGLGWRATESWHEDNSEVLSSEGKDRSNVDSTLGRWFYMQGDIDGVYAGAVVMSHPDNFNHPEPIRIWPADHGPRGAVFANFSPTKNTDWLIQPGEHYVMTYRFLVYNGHMDNAGAESAWQAFASPPSVKVIPAQ